MVGWHHRLNGHGFVGTLGFGDRRGGLACCSSWVCKESDMTATELNCNTLCDHNTFSEFSKSSHQIFKPEGGLKDP